MAFPKAPAILGARDLRAAELEERPNEALLRIYAWMQLARLTDNRILDLFRQGLIRGTVTGGQGNEWMIVPLALLADKALDVISFTHRDLGGHLIWGGTFASTSTSTSRMRTAQPGRARATSITATRPTARFR